MLDATNSNENFVWQILLFTLCGGKARSVFINCFAFFSEHSINYNAFDVFESQPYLLLLMLFCINDISAGSKKECQHMCFALVCFLCTT